MKTDLSMNMDTAYLVVEKIVETVLTVPGISMVSRTKRQAWGFGVSFTKASPALAYRYQACHTQAHAALAELA
ncbi:hypothetical protein OUZ56_026288 [Daphnia magna]|uniref:Uncharacterized protein n=1 Tax=Daphnia magna TaxID=35525 RepID=A0ABQ9ZM38_9CRUS|nr:hypothetical protein OUZ56_026288 [Daphnia magna]